MAITIIVIDFNNNFCPFVNQNILGNLLKQFNAQQVQVEFEKIYIIHSDQHEHKKLLWSVLNILEVNNIRFDINF